MPDERPIERWVWWSRWCRTWFAKRLNYLEEHTNERSIASVSVIAYSKFVRILSNLPERFLRLCFPKVMCLSRLRDCTRVSSCQRNLIHDFFLYWRIIVHICNIQDIFSFIRLYRSIIRRNAELQIAFISTDKRSLPKRKTVTSASIGKRFFAADAHFWAITIYCHAKKQSALVSRNVYFIFSSLSPSYISSILVVPPIVLFAFTWASPLLTLAELATIFLSWFLGSR